MNVALHRPPMTREAFLAWEARQEFRYEFNGWAPEAKTGGTDRHSAIKVNLVAALRGLLRGTAWRVFDSDMMIDVAGSYRYPDAIVAAGQLDGARIKRDPVVVLEVLSESTAAKDFVTKNAEYRATSSIRRYVMLEQDQVGATVFERAGKDWVGHLVTEADATIALPEVGISLRLADLYEDIGFPEPDAV